MTQRHILFPLDAIGPEPGWLPPFHSEYPLWPHLIMDLHDCTAATPGLPAGEEVPRIASRASITQYAHEIVELLEMKAYGNPTVEHFGHARPDTSGFTLIQLIEDSNITGHFREQIGKAHIELFTCKPFDVRRAADFTVEFFGARDLTASVLYR